MNLKFRQATIKNLPEIVRMLSDDFLGATRVRYENPFYENLGFKRSHLGMKLYLKK